MKNLTSRPVNNPFATLLATHPAAFTPPPSARTLDRAATPRSPWGWLLARIERWAWNARQKELERALASATDLGDVEKRLRAYERGVLHRYY